jgi:glycosyltransferase involved in cell wall biosynthesis
MLEVSKNAKSCGDEVIRVCYVLDELRQGGTELRLMRLLGALPSQGICPSLVLLRNESSELRKKIVCPVLDLELRSLRSISLLHASRRLYRFLKEHRTHILEPYFFDAIVLSVPVARSAGVKQIIRTSFNMGHSISFGERIMYRLLKPLFSVTLTNSEQGRVAAQRNFGLSFENVTVLPNGIDLSGFLKVPVCENKTRDGFHIGMVANLRPVKGVSDFIEAASLLVGHSKHLRFSVAGDGPQRHELERLVERLGLSSCFSFMGSLTNVPEYLSKIDIAVLASHAEGMSNALIEYMAAGRPVIATNVGGACELIGDDDRGFLVEAKQPNSLFCAMKDIVSDYEVAIEKAVRARSFVASRYSVERMAQEYAEFYRAQYNKSVDKRIETL